MFALTLLSSAPVSYLVSPTAHVHSVTVLTLVARTSRALMALVLTALTLAALVLALLLVGVITLAGIAHRHAGYTPLLCGPNRTPTPSLALPACEWRGSVVHGPSLRVAQTSSAPANLPTVNSCVHITNTEPTVMELTEYEKAHPVRFAGGGTQVRPSTQYGNDLHHASVVVLKRAAKVRGLKGYTALLKPALVDLLTSEGLTFEDVSVLA